MLVLLRNHRRYVALEPADANAEEDEPDNESPKSSSIIRDDRRECCNNEDDVSEGGNHNCIVDGSEAAPVGVCEVTT